MSKVESRSLFMEDEEFFFNLINLNVPGTTTIDPETTLIIFDVPSSGDTGSPGIPAPATLTISSAAPTPVSGFVDTEGNFTNGDFNFNIGTTEFNVGVPVPVGDRNNDGGDDSVVLNGIPTAAIPAQSVAATLVLNPTPPPAPVDGSVDLQGNFTSEGFEFNLGETELIIGTPIPVGDRNNDGANDTVVINTLPTAAVAAVDVEATLLTFATVVDGFIDVEINENEVETVVTLSFLDNQTGGEQFDIEIITTGFEEFEAPEENVPINIGDQNNDSFDDFIVIFPQNEIAQDEIDEPVLQQIVQGGTLFLSTPLVGTLNTDGDFSSDNFNFNVGTTVIEENAPINVGDLEENGIPNIVIPNGTPTPDIPAQPGTATLTFGETDPVLVAGILDAEGNFTNDDSEISFNVGTTEIIEESSIIVGDIDQNGIDDFVIPNGTPTAAIPAQPSPADLIFGTPEPLIIEGSLDFEGNFIGNGFSLDVGTTDFVEGGAISVGDLNGDSIIDTVTPNEIPTLPSPGIPDTVAPSTLISGPLPDR
ncbi:MAG: hypothetical protein F6J89_25985 [Symploca sp. SIO1C4]|uniref:Uncharacterized protein n=1 Tax=Symploca sp. SIO1C4 TaxID=2607765 RepID=A0A6B3NJ99_9CYAN|nr:hypothetical protein [Symploca sp. SIO1C4]